jgi:hypothetical protein
MELTEEQPKRRMWLYLIVIILIIAIGFVYFTFLAPGGGFLSKIFKGKITDFSLVPDALKKDVTGGIADLKFTPEDILENPKFKNLRVYSEPTEFSVNLGRPNPFLPF